MRRMLPFIALTALGVIFALTSADEPEPFLTVVVTANAWGELATCG